MAQRVPAWFWSWARWRLGRGEYKGHAGDTRVRPRSAPKRIPLWAFQRFAREFGKVLPKPKPKPKPKPTARDRVVANAKWGVEHEAAIHYTMSEQRDDWLHVRARSLPMFTDCSGFATACYDWAGLPDPNGLGYKKLGYTGTLLDHAEKHGEILRDVSRALPGDLIVYGPGTGKHVAVVVRAGKDPLTVSHGEEGGPAFVRVSDDGRQPQRVLRFIGER